MLAEHLFKHPRSAFYRTGPVWEGSHCKNAGHAKDPATISICDLDASHFWPGDVFFEPIDLRKVRIQECVIAVDKIHDAKVTADNAIE